MLSEWLELDPEWYLLAYPEAGKDISAGRARDAARHYRKFGRKRGWNPNVFFSEKFYLDHYADVAESVRSGVYANGFAHFVGSGYAEGRRPNGWWVGEAWYRDRYPDAAAAVDGGRCRSVYEHYLREGAAQGRAELAVREPGVGADGDGVGNLHDVPHASVGWDCGR